MINIYIDKKSGNNTTSRNEFQRMLNDCQNGKIDIIVTKSISRFGRNTVDTQRALNTLHNYSVDVFFENEGLHTKDGQDTFIISLLEGVAQEESANMSKNISWGILRKIESGDAQLLSRKCFGYSKSVDGHLQIKNDEAEIVKLIFNLYLEGASIVGIIKELEGHSIKSPTGNNKWHKRTIESRNI